MHTHKKMRPPHRNSFFSQEEYMRMNAYRTPANIQTFINTIPFNFETDGETCMSPRRVIREWKAHCMEGALLAAAMLRLQGYAPIIMDLKTGTREHDYDHVVALFRQHGCWGAISKTNHAVLRYREPIYRTPRELALSYFHEYFLNSTGKKTLRGYSRPFHLSRFDVRQWVTSEEDLFYIPHALDRSPHYPILSKQMIKILRPADDVERKAGAIEEWTP